MKRMAGWYTFGGSSRIKGGKACCSGVQLSLIPRLCCLCVPLTPYAAVCISPHLSSFAISVSPPHLSFFLSFVPFGLFCSLVSDTACQFNPPLIYLHLILASHPNTPFSLFLFHSLLSFTFIVPKTLFIPSPIPYHRYCPSLPLCLTSCTPFTLLCDHCLIILSFSCVSTLHPQTVDTPSFPLANCSSLKKSHFWQTLSQQAYGKPLCPF